MKEYRFSGKRTALYAVVCVLMAVCAGAAALGMLDYSRMPLRGLYHLILPLGTAVCAAVALRLGWRALKRPVGLIVAFDSIEIIPPVYGPHVLVRRTDVASVLDRGGVVYLVHADGRLRVMPHLYRGGESIAEAIREMWGPGFVTPPGLVK